MSSLTAIFGNSAEKSQDSDKLLNLYWNRAELKKEFARLRREQWRLQDRVKEQEGATARLQQKLDYLEDMLVDPETVGNVLVFYQLRALALRCEHKLSKLAAQLMQQQEQRRRKSLLVRWQDERASEARAVEEELGVHREEARRIEGRMQAKRNRVTAMNGLLRFLRRRSLTASLDALAAEVEAMARREEELLESLAEIRNRPLPQDQGLDVASKRSINLMILSYAQQLYLLFRDDDLAALTKEAMDKSAGTINYGDWAACEHLLRRIRKRLAALEGTGDKDARLLRERARLIGEEARFRGEDDVVPLAASVSTVYDLSREGTARRGANLLGENYWGIARVLCR